MKKIRMFGLLAVPILLFTVLLGIATQGFGNTLSDVHFTVIRLDYFTYAFEGFYEFSQPYQESLPEPGYWQEGNVFWKWDEPDDDGYTMVKSRLTGDLILHATTIWMGGGNVIYPPSSTMSTTIEHGYANPEPDTLIYLPIPDYCGGYDSYADSALARVADTDIINRVASRGGYEVYIWRHFYTVGFCDPSTAEYFIIAASYQSPTGIHERRDTWGRIKALYREGAR
jgi:hypothetical protein